MKKLFMFLAVAGLATFGASCSKSDDNGGKEEKQLTIAADKTTVNEGDTVTFTSNESGAEFHVEGKKVTNKYKFATKGDYKVVAKKSGFKDSTALVIKVTEKGTTPEEKQLTLVATPSTVKVGESVMFVVKEGSNMVNDATITQVGGAVVTGGTWKATAEGTVKFKATKAGFKDSVEVSVTVEKAPVVPTGNYMKMGSDVLAIEYSRMTVDAEKDPSDGKFYIKTYAVKDDNGNDIEYCVYHFNVGKINDAGTEYEGLTKLSFAVFQKVGDTKLYFPGQDATLGMQFLGGWTTFDFENATQYKFEDFISFNINPVAKSSSDTGGAEFELEQGTTAVDFSGLFSVKTLGVVDVDAAKSRGGLDKKVSQVVNVSTLRKMK